MKGILQYKALGNAVKDVDVKNRVITGYLSQTDVEDLGKDTIVKGSFKKTLGENRNNIFFLNQHKFDQPHGKFAVLQEDGYGLYFESEPLINTTYSDDALKLYEAGIMREHSIGYITTQADQKESGSRIIKEVKLFEGSNVTQGMNPGARFLGFKDRSPKELDLQIKRIIKYLREGNISDDGFMLLEYSLKELQAQSIELGKTLAEGKPENHSTYADIEPSIETINKFINKF